MTLWPCFICNSRGKCKHREPELLAWLIGVPLQRAIIRDGARMASSQPELFGEQA